LHFDRALGIGQPIFRHPAQRLDDRLGDLMGDPVVDLALLTGFQIGRERLAAFLDQTRQIVGE
jgi:hypothetical protein